MNQTAPRRERAHPAPREYVQIAAVLATITIIEVAVYYLEVMRPILVPTLVVLSATKFAMVAMWYMHLKFDNRLFSVFFVGGLLLAAAVFIALMALFRALFA